MGKKFLNKTNVSPFQSHDVAFEEMKSHPEVILGLSH